MATRFKTFQDKLNKLVEKYPELTKEYVEEMGKEHGSYSFFDIKFHLDGLNIGSFLKEWNLKEITEVKCQYCNMIFTKQKYKNIATPKIRHEKCCKIKFDFIKKYNWTKESLEEELEKLGTVQDFIKKYSEIGKLAYELLKDFNIDTSIKKVGHIIRERGRQTSIERYGSEHNFCKNHPSRKQWEQKLFEEEGITNVWQREEVKQKIKNTLFKKYGVYIPYHSNIIKEKGKQTCLEKYGYEHHMKSPEFLEEFIQSRIDKFGYYSVCDFYKNNNHGIVFSKPHKKIVELLIQNNIDCKIEYIIKIGKEDYVEGGNKTLYEYDILIDNNKLIEINGDYYHANPNIYKSDDILNFFGKDILAKIIWKKDKLKLDFAQKKGYNIKVIWEYDIYNNWEKVSKEVLEYARIKD